MRFLTKLNMHIKWMELMMIGCMSEAIVNLHFTINYLKVNVLFI